MSDTFYLPLIDIQGIHKSYHTPAGDVPALRGVNLQVEAGEFVAVLGKSGAGKSTLVNVLTGIDQPDAGEVLVSGVRLHRMGEDQRARWRGKHMGVVFQFFQLIPNLNLVKNVTLPMDFCNTFPLRERNGRALYLLELVGLGEHASKTPSEISGGQQQRVAIARALANDPEILVADEPTGNLDWRTASEVLDLFSRLVELGKTLLIVTHDREIAGRASRQVTIADGSIVSESNSFEAARKMESRA
jgi:putative ABC transport system ATP-binding protein